MTRLIFDFPDEQCVSRPRVFTEPAEVVIAHNLSEVLPALREVEAATARGLTAAGFIAYEAAPAFEPAFRVREGSRMPLVWFGLFDGHDSPGESNALLVPGKATQIVPPSRERFEAAVADIREAIAEGRTYQVNLTTRLDLQVDGAVLGLYEQLRLAQRAGLHACLELDDFDIVSLSPELFFRRVGDVISTRPMKGTMRRGRFLEEDRERAAALRGSAKERAENLMIVDLLRNDLGRIALTGSVEVPSLFDVEIYPTVLQMTSTVTAKLREDTRLTEILAALFPCGSVTGAPKISTMAMIAELEDSPREVYCGAIGVVEPGGDCTFSVPIRTLWIDRVQGTASYGAGGGITWDSHAGNEYDEVLAKAAILTERWPAFELFETMLLEDGVIRRLGRHLDRLRDSCAYFDYPWPGAAIESAVAAWRVDRSPEPKRVRLLVARDGAVRTTTEPWEPPRDAPQPVALAGTPVSSSDRFLFHKTTNREVYERHAAEHPAVFDVLLWNERGELTEFSRGNVVIELDGERVTPPRTAGLLAGTFRAELIEAGTIKERPIPKARIERSAPRIWLINSVREWVEVVLDPPVATT